MGDRRRGRTMEWTVAAALAATSGSPGGTDDNSCCPAIPTLGFDHAATITVKPPGNRVPSAIIVDGDFELADGEQFLSKTASLSSAGDRSFRGLEAMPRQSRARLPIESILSDGRLIKPGDGGVLGNLLSRPVDPSSWAESAELIVYNDHHRQRQREGRRA